MTDLENVKLLLVEDRGSRYLFQAGKDNEIKYYFYNTVTQDAGEVVEPKTYPEILSQMAQDIEKVQVTEIPEPEWRED